MLSPEMARVLERIEARRRQTVFELAAAAAPPATPEQRIGSSFAPGMRIFDRVTGLEGEVISGTRENILVPTPER